MKKILKLILLGLVLFSMSCSTVKQNITKNNRSMDKLISSLLDKNGNAFYLTSSYANFSTVWSYGEHDIEVYRLASGKPFEHQTFPDTGFSKYEIPTRKELDIEIQDCGYELDGDGFGFRLKGGSEIKQQDLPISIECFTKLKYESEFLNKIVEDINNYKMWDVRYK